MNKNWILQHLGEALEALQGMIEEIRADEEFGFTNYRPEMRHLYGHLNTAWNSRDVDEKDVQQRSEEDFSGWRQFPGDIRM